MGIKAQGKRFLTERGDEGGSVRWSLYYELDGTKSTDCSLTITDCFRVVELEFDYATLKGHTKRISKLDNLIEELQSLRTELLKAKPSTPKYYY